MSEADRPVFVDGSVFENYAEASNFLVRRVSESHHISRLFIPRVAGRLIPDGRKQVLHLIGDGKEGRIERGDRGISVSTASALDIDVIAHVERWDSNLLDRGLAWVSVGAETPSRFSVIIDAEHEIEDTREITARLITAEANAVTLINGILNNDPAPEFAERFPGDTSNDNYNLSV